MNYPPGLPPPRRADVMVRCTNDDCPTAVNARVVCDCCGGARVVEAVRPPFLGGRGVEPCLECEGKGWLLDDDARETYEGAAVVDLGGLWLKGDAEECRVCGGEVEVL